MNDFLHGNALTSLLPAFFGAVVGVVRDEGISVKQAFLKAFSGMLIAVYVGPAICDFLGVTPQQTNLYSAIIFIIGLSGFSLIPILINATVQVVRYYVSSTDNNKK